MAKKKSSVKTVRMQMVQVTLSFGPSADGDLFDIVVRADEDQVTLPANAAFSTVKAGNETETMLFLKELLDEIKTAYGSREPKLKVKGSRIVSV